MIPREQFFQFVDFLCNEVRVIGAQTFRHTVVQMAFENIRLQTLYGRANRTQLREDIRAGALFFDHLFHAADLARNAVDAGEVYVMGRIFGGFASNRAIIYPIGV